MPLDSKHRETSFLPNLTDPLSLQLTRVPGSLDSAIFVSTMTQPIASPLVHAHGVNYRLLTLTDCELASKQLQDVMCYVYSVGEEEPEGVITS